MSLTWKDNIQDTANTHEEGPQSEMPSMFALYQLMSDEPVGTSFNVAVRIGVYPHGFTITKHGEMEDA